jgi:hypothetical protein
MSRRESFSPGCELPAEGHEKSSRLHDSHPFYASDFIIWVVSCQSLELVCSTNSRLFEFSFKVSQSRRTSEEGTPKMTTIKNVSKISWNKTDVA